MTIKIKNIFNTPKSFPVPFVMSFQPSPHLFHSKTRAILICVTTYQFIRICINGIIDYILFFFFQLLSPGIIISRFIHIVACMKCSFSCIAVLFHYMAIPILIIHLSVGGYLFSFFSYCKYSCFEYLRTGFCMGISLGYLPRSRMVGSYGKCVIDTLNNCQTTFQSSILLCIPTCEAGEFYLFHTLGMVSLLKLQSS